MSQPTVDPIVLHLALRRIAEREAAARGRRRGSAGFWRGLFTPRARREHLVRLSPAEVVHNNLAS